MSTSSDLPDLSPAGDVPLDAKAAAGVISRWIENNRHWSMLVAQPDAFAQNVIQTVSANGEALTRKRLMAEATRKAGAQLHALCASQVRTEQELGYTVLAVSLHRLALSKLHNQMLADDATQNALQNIFRKFAQARDPQIFIHWCNVILLHEVSRLGRKAANQDAHEISIDKENDDADGGTAQPVEETLTDPRQESVDDVVAGDMRNSAVWKCLEACRALNDRARRLIIFLWRDALPYSNIATLWHTTVGNLQVIFFRAKKAMTRDADFLRCLQGIGV